MTATVANLNNEQIAKVAARVMQRCHELSRFSEDPSCLTRTFCSPPMVEAHQQLTGWMTSAGLRCQIDALANLIGRSADEKSRAFIIGSHLDTVVNAGQYDGPLGVLLGLGVVELCNDAGLRLPFALDVVGFSEEEGVRFQTPFLGSRSMAGKFSQDLYDITDEDGISVREALDAFTLASPCPIADYPVERLIGFLEPHIEQGPLLEQLGAPLGVVTRIAGQTRVTFQFTGQAGHAGTVPHPLRKDAVAAVAEFVSGVERIGRQMDGLFATIGEIRAWPNVSNVIAGRARARLDLRHADDDCRAAAYAEIKRLAASIADQRQLEWCAEACEQHAGVPMDECLSQKLDEAICRSGRPVHRMVSGAGHDAMLMARRTPTSMLFLRCRGGISHHPDEAVTLEDVAAALHVLMNFIGLLET